MLPALVAIVALASVAFSTSLAAAKAQPPNTAPQSPFMRVYRSEPPPNGFVQYCKRDPAECTPAPFGKRRFEATPDRLAEIDEINRFVNQTIAPATDLEIFGVQEFWFLPTDRGDCEDYALLKRHLLIRRGWPQSALLMTVVRNSEGEGHAVLTARTTQGDFILDNMVADIRLWHQTRYHFIMRQSSIDPNVWFALDPGEGAQSSTLTSAPTRR